MKTAKTLSWLVAVAGLWEVLASFILAYSATRVAMWNAIIAGVVLIILGVWAAVNERVSLDRTLNWISAVVGVWLVVSPFILGYSAVATAMLNDIIVGVVVIVLSGWAATLLGRLVAPQT